MKRVSSVPGEDYRGREYALDHLSPYRHLRTAFENEVVIPLDELVRSYRHPNAADLTRVKLHHGLDDDLAAAAFLLTDAISHLSALSCDHGVVSLQPGAHASDFRFQGKKVPPIKAASVLHGLFDPEREDNLAENVRERPGKGGSAATKGKAFDELVASMRAFGWSQYLPAVMDKRGTVIVGHRRIAAAEEAGIPIEDRRIITVDFGEGDEAEAAKAALAIASNLGGEALNPADRRKIAARLCKAGWSIGAIAETLKVKERSVYRDLAGVPKPTKRGRPSEPNLTSVQIPKPPGPKAQEAQEAIARLVEKGVPVTQKALEREGIKITTANSAVAAYKAALATSGASPVDDSSPSSPGQELLKPVRITIHTTRNSEPITTTVFRRSPEPDGKPRSRLMLAWDEATAEERDELRLIACGFGENHE